MKFNEWKEKYCVNLGAFAKKIGSSVPTLHRIIRGGTPSLKVAISIERATEYRVQAHEMLSNEDFDHVQLLSKGTTRPDV